MGDIDLAEQLVDYLDATTEPVAFRTGRRTLDDAPGVELRRSMDVRIERSSRVWLAAAAAVAVIGVVGAIAIATSRSDVDDDLVPSGPPTPSAVDSLPGVTESSEPPSTEPPLDGDDAEAIAFAEAYFTSMAAGEADEVIARSDLTTLAPEKEAALTQWWSVAAWPELEHPGWPSGDCSLAPVPAVDDSVTVLCPLEVGDPVAVELGVASLVWTVSVARDGSVTRGAEPNAPDFKTYGAVWSAYRDYIDVHAPEGGTACDPAEYDSGAIWSAGGLALTGPCAEVTSALADAVAEWIGNGRPSPGTAAAARGAPSA